MRYAVIRTQDKQVRNVVEFDGGIEWFPPDGFFAEPSETLNIGEFYQGEE